jgi:hypothetical protein
MAETKYGKYILTDLIRDIGHYTGYSLLSHEGELGIDCSIGYHCISAPISFDKPHSHDFVELLCFIGGNPADITDLGAEIEFCMGEEQEKHIITKTAVVSMPAGLVHCPIKITKVEKPIVFLEISLTSKYGTPVARSQ